MSRRRKHIRVRVLRSFNGLRKGDESGAYLDDRMQGWINAGMIEVIEGGKDQARPGGAEPDADERVADGAAGGVSPGGEPGEGFGAGAFGSSEGLDQG